MSDEQQQNGYAGEPPQADPDQGGDNVQPGDEVNPGASKLDADQQRIEDNLTESQKQARDAAERRDLPAPVAGPSGQTSGEQTVSTDAQDTASTQQQ